MIIIIYQWSLGWSTVWSSLLEIPFIYHYITSQLPCVWSWSCVMLEVAADFFYIKPRPRSFHNLKHVLPVSKQKYQKFNIAVGQSVWVDAILQDWIFSVKYVVTEHLTGMFSINVFPTTFPHYADRINNSASITFTEKHICCWLLHTSYDGLHTSSVM